MTAVVNAVNTVAIAATVAVTSVENAEAIVNSVTVAIVKIAVVGENAIGAFEA